MIVHEDTASPALRDQAVGTGNSAFHSDPRGEREQRLGALEAVRGLAALAVVFHHLLLMLWPALKHARQTSLLGHLLSDTPLNVAHNGALAVRLFFVLSGVVLSLAFFRRQDSMSLSSAAFRRYPRLAIPVAASVLVAYLLLVCHAFYNVAACEVLHRPAGDWFRSLYQFQPSLGSAGKEAFYDAFFRFDPSATYAYNAVLWTMGVELQGSMLVFSLLALAGRLRQRWLIYLALIGLLVLLGMPLLVDFVVGVCIADFFVWAPRHGRSPQLTVSAMGLLLALGLTIGSLKATVLDDLGLSYLIVAPGYWKTVGAALVILCALYSPGLRRGLECRPLAWLGKISFSLYLIHLPILCSLGAWLLTALLLSGVSFVWSAAVVVAACVAATLLAAQLMTATVERWAIIWPAKAFDRYFRLQSETQR